LKPAALIEKGVISTLCRMCENRCSIDVHMRDYRMRRITPGANNPANRGRMCPRGMAALDVFYHPDRLHQPLKRQADGTYKPITRDQALDEIAARIRQLIAKDGARSIGVWKGEAVGFQQQEAYARRFAHALGTPNYFSNDSACFNGRFLGHYLLTGFWNPFAHYSKADLILLFGTNPPVCHPPFMAEFADAKARGAHLVVIDPRLNPVACYADVFAQPCPGTDGALAWGLIRYLIENDGYDKAFVERYCVGFDKIAAYAQRFTPAQVEKLTGVYADVVVQIGELIRQNRPRISLYVGAGLEHHENGVNNIRALATMACICGALDIECGLTWPEPLPLNTLTLYEEKPLDDLAPIGADRFPVLYDIRKECHTMTAMDYMLGKGAYPLRGLILTAANPAVTNPNSRKVQAALKSLDLLVVNDLFMTQTAKLADYVLPAASFLERSEIHVNTKLQRVYLTNKVAQIPGVEDEYRLWHDLAQRLGFGAQYFPWPHETAVNRYLLEPSGIDLAQLARHPEGIQYKTLRFKKHLTQPLPTSSGKVELASAYLKALGLPEIPEYFPPYHLQNKNDDYPLLLTTGARKTLFYHSRHQNIPHFRKIHPRAQVEIHPDDAATLGIQHGEPVRIVSESGALVVEAKIVHAAELRKGVIEVYHGWEQWPINQVTFDAINDPISGFPLLKAVPVRVEKVR
jgi:anaerobic selenocysteine-containing dehydrogenase